MLNISIVLYNNAIKELAVLVRQLLHTESLDTLYLIDNSTTPLITDIERQLSLSNHTEKIDYRWNNGDNPGYGRAHNIALRESIKAGEKLHLVMNADIEVKAGDIDLLCRFMMKNSIIGSLMPKVAYPDGSTQYLCKLLPTPWDVFARRFLPHRWTEKRNNRYELLQSGYDRMMNVPYLSGCFMLLRVNALKKAGIFDERYFMYPEDIDLTRRLHRDYLTVFVPDITIVHHHGQASYRSLRMTLVHIVNMCRYFNKWGWFIDKERDEVNRLTLEQF